uniref:hypothetical protein n=1 Tax=Microvirga roseola TaxID=2883126 RepID=UPI001E4D60B3
AVCLDRQGPGADQHGPGPDLEQLRRVELVKEHAMMGMMDGTGMGWMMAGMGLVWLLIAILLVLGIAALVKYLRR